MRPPDPISTLDLFPEERSALLHLLTGLTPDEWELPTVCPGWSVKDVALHILGGDLGNLSRRRDGFQAPAGTSPEDLVAFINSFNDEWVRAARRLSPRVVIDLLRFTGPQLFDYFSTLDLSALGGGVSWAGLDSAPVWLDVAREYTERWLHQQHIRDAVDKPGLTDRRFMGPVLSTFVYALPQAYRSTVAEPGTIVQLYISGEAGGDWSLVREAEDWALYEGGAPEPNASVAMSDSIAWRLFTKGINPQDAARSMEFEGDRHLGEQVLQAVAIIA